MTTPHEKACREAFHIYAHKRHLDCFRHEDGSYSDGDTAYAWSIWQAASDTLTTLLSDPEMVEELARAIHEELRRSGTTAYTFEEVVNNVGIEKTIAYREAQAALAAIGRRVGV